MFSMESFLSFILKIIIRKLFESKINKAGIAELLCKNRQAL